MGACKRPWIWRGDDGRSYPLPCGKCLACRIRRRSIWAIRMLHELTTCGDSSFITLTYSDEHLPVRGSDPRGVLLKSDLQKFHKRARRAGSEYRYYACGEYGDKGGRPHYHAILFGWNPSPRELEVLWSMGRVDVATAEVASVRYVAGYVSKKLGLSDYDLSNRPPPFQCASNGIGLAWASSNMIENLYDGALTYRGKSLPIPRYYVNKYEELFPEAVYGFKARQSWESDLALSDTILELCPQFGGRSWSLLSISEKEIVIKALTARGELIDADLRSQDSLREANSKL